MEMFLRMVLLVLTLLLNRSSAAPRITSTDEDDSCPQLPQHAMPREAGIYIAPNFNTNTFEGIALYPLFVDLYGRPEGISTFELFAEDLDITFCQVLLLSDGETMHETIQRVRNGVTDPFVCQDTTYDNKTQKLIVSVGDVLQDWRRYRVSFEYTGKIRNDMTGFYKTTYNVGTAKREVLATQFQPTHARKVFPSFDEPLFKTNYTIAIAIPSGYPEYAATSNMPLQAGVTDANGVRIFQFYPTPPMSSYLVAWLVSDFSAAEDPQNAIKDVAIRTLARTNALDSAAYSLQVTRTFVEYLEDYTGIPYLYKYHEPQTLNKIDQAAIPDFSGGAMENWGLVTYRETRLLYSDGPESARRRVSLVIAHELVHMWFGNLVTTARWDTTWLNEGFAELLEWLVADQAQEGWRLEEQFVVDDMHSALAADALESSSPLSRRVCSPADAAAAFYSLTYTKGASVLRMFSYIIGQDNFREALRNYLSKNAFKAVEPEDLFRELKVFAGAAGLSYYEMHELLRGWTEQNGYPMVLVMRNYLSRTANVSQIRYHMTPRNFDYPLHYVPLTWTQRGHGFHDRRPQLYLTADQPEKTVGGMPDSDAWVIFNVQQTGFYRVNYDLGNWELLAQHLSDAGRPLDAVHPLNRAQLLDDALSFARSGHLPYGLVLRLLDYLRRETDYIPWTAAFGGLGYVHRMLATHPRYPLFKQYFLNLILNLYERFDFQPQQQHLDKLLLNRVSTWACALDHPHCVQSAVDSLRGFLNEAQPIPADLRSVVYCHGIRNAEDSDPWRSLWEEYLKSPDEEDRTLIINGLACSRDSSLLQELLSYSLNSDYIRKQDASSVFSAVYSNSLGVEVALDFLSDNFNEIFSYYGAMGAIQNIVTGIAGRVTTEDQKEKLEKLIEDYRTELGSTADSALDIMQPNLDWLNQAETIFESIEEKYLYRLPSLVLPQEYHLFIIPDPQGETFEGDVSIIVEVEDYTENIYLHAQDLTISESNILVTRHEDSSTRHNSTGDTQINPWKEKSTREENLLKGFQVLEDFNLIKLITAIELDPRYEYRIQIKYSGPLRKDMVGFYSTYYLDDRGERHSLLATKFAPTHARKAFPCFDEPSFKATFKITVVIPNSLPGYSCIANAAEISRTNRENGGTEVVFDYTPVMSTYIVAWVISDLIGEKSTNQDGDITYTTWVRGNARATASYSLEVTPEMVKKLEKYTGYPYFDENHPHPLKKLDQVGTPDFVSGAMENWGLITYRETALLYREGASAAAKKRVATVIAHELAHMWFGNLVTCAWWSATWLNEGFATYFQHLITQQVEGNWGVMDQLLVDQLQAALAADADLSAKALTHSVLTPSDAVASFGSLTYSKGASIIRMLGYVIGNENLENAIQSYVAKNKYEAVQPEDFFAEVLPFSGGSGLNEDEMLQFLRSWTEQPGYPVLYVTRFYDGSTRVTLIQERYLTKLEDITPQLWYIPLSWIEPGDNYDHPIVKDFLSNKNRTKDIYGFKEDSWLLFNTHQIGYFRVLYDEENWRRLSAALRQSRDALHWLNRAQLLDDAFAFARSGRLSYAQLLALADYLPPEDEYPPWAAALAGLASLDRLLAAHPSRRRFQAYVLSLVEEAYDKYGFRAFDDWQSGQLIAAAVTARACAMGHSGCRARAVALLQQHLNGSASLDGDMRSAVYCHGLRHSATSDAAWDELWRALGSERDEVERGLLLTALGCSANADKLTALLENTIKEQTVRKQEATSAFAAVYATMEGAEVTLRFLQDKYTETKAYLGSVDSIVTGVANRLVTTQQRTELVSLLERRWNDGLSSVGPSALKIVDDNIQWNVDFADALIDLVNDKTPIPPPTTTTEASDTTTDSLPTDSVTEDPSDSTTVEEPSSTTDSASLASACLLLVVVATSSVYFI